MAAQRDLLKEFEILMENSPLGIVLTTPESEFLSVTNTFRDMLGYTAKEFERLTVQQITHPDSFAVSIDAIQRVFAGEGPITVRKQYVRKDGGIIDANTRIAAVFDDDGRPLYQCTNIEDITAKLKTDRELTHQATHDALTGLINRREFEHRADELLRLTKQDNCVHTLLFMDLDQFKVVNDTCGHTAGDELLRQVSSMLMVDLRKGDTLARLGGDEFGLLLAYCEPLNATEVAQAISARVEQFTFTWDNRRFKIGVSIGITSIDESTESLSMLIRDADSACYAAKSHGGHRVHVHDANDAETGKIHNQTEWVVRINQALEENQFRLYAQSIASLRGSLGLHYETLLRMSDNEDMHNPGLFLPAAERYSLVPKIDRWVIAESLRILAREPAFLEKLDFCAINLSGLSITDPEFLRYAQKQLQKSGIPGHKLCFEITETAAASDLNAATRFITELRRMGCRFSLDDFGSGLSSFGYLKNLPVDYLKIDGVFIHNIADDGVDLAIVKSINDIGKELGLQTIAEFVSNSDTIALLREVGVDFIQGFGVDMPIPIEEFIARHTPIHT